MGTNDITGDKLISKPNNKNYEEGYDRIFKSKLGKVKDDADRQHGGDVSNIAHDGLDANKGDCKTS